MRNTIALFGGFALTVCAHSAYAASVTAQSGLAFTSGGTCTVTGNTANLGNFSSTDTVRTYVEKFGSTSSLSAPTASAVTLATVDCSNGLAYSVAIAGNRDDKAANVVRAGQVSSDVFSVVPQLTSVDSTSVTKMYIHGADDLSTYYGSGNGKGQILSGYWVISSPSDELLDQALDVGSYSASATVTVNF